LTNGKSSVSVGFAILLGWFLLGTQQQTTRHHQLALENTIEYQEYDFCEFL